MNRWNLCSFPLALLLLTPVRHAQEVTTLALEEIEIYAHQVQNTDPDELFDLAAEFVGREYVVKERGPNSTFNLRLLGETIVVYDTQGQVTRARELFERLDVPQAEKESRAAMVEYRPRFVSLETALSAVRALVEVSPIEQRGLIVLQGSNDDVQKALALLGRIDAPEKQVLLTCQLIELGATQQGPALPKDLLDNLQKLLPGTSFTQVGMALLKTSVAGDQPISIQIESTGKRYVLYLTPVAFDEASSALTVADCRLVDVSDSGEARELFSTNTVLRSNEYTCLAGTGATPRLLVLRFTVQS